MYILFIMLVFTFRSIKPMESTGASLLFKLPKDVQMIIVGYVEAGLGIIHPLKDTKNGYVDGERSCYNLPNGCSVRYSGDDIFLDAPAKQSILISKYHHEHDKPIFWACAKDGSCVASLTSVFVCGKADACLANTLDFFDLRTRIQNKRSFVYDSAVYEGCKAFAISTEGGSKAAVVVKKNTSSIVHLYDMLTIAKAYQELPINASFGIITSCAFNKQGNKIIIRDDFGNNQIIPLGSDVKNSNKKTFIEYFKEHGICKLEQE